MTHDISEHTLDNGLRVALLPDPAAPVVGVAVYYDVGSRDEVPGMSGFAHLFEHMMFEGSQNVAKGEHFKHIHAWGGQVNGTTSQDRTNYYESLPSHQLALGLWLEADRMRSLAVTAENFENQRQTVMEERRQRIDNSPYGAAFVRINELSFDNWAMAHPVIGSWEDLHNARLESVQAFHGRWYRPNNAVLAVAGDFDRAEALGRIEDLFGDIETGPRRAPTELHEPLRTAPIDADVDDPLAQLPAVFVNHQAPPFGHPDFYVWEVIETVLFRGPSSRVYRRLVIDDQLAVQVSGGYEAHRGPSLFGIFCACPQNADLATVVEAYCDELKKLATAPLSTSELDKTLNQLRSAKVFSQESVLNRAMSLGRAALFHGDATWEEHYLQRVGQVTAEQVQDLARRAFSDQARAVLRVNPT